MTNTKIPIRPSLGLAVALVLLFPVIAAGDRKAGDGFGPAAELRLTVKTKFRAHESWVRCLAWSPDGRVLASGGTDRAIRFWDRASLEATATSTVAPDVHGDP